MRIITGAIKPALALPVGAWGAPGGGREPGAHAQSCPRTAGRQFEEVTLQLGVKGWARISQSQQPSFIRNEGPLDTASF